MDKMATRERRRSEAIEVWFADEARVARRTRSPAAGGAARRALPKISERSPLYLRRDLPKDGKGAASSCRCDTEAMNLHLAEIAQITPGAHAALSSIKPAGIVGRAHRAANVTDRVPPKCQTEPQENSGSSCALALDGSSSFNDIVDAAAMHGQAHRQHGASCRSEVSPVTCADIIPHSSFILSSRCSSLPISSISGLIWERWQRRCGFSLTAPADLRRCVRDRHRPARGVHALFALCLRAKMAGLSLLAYVATVFAVDVPWLTVARNLVVPHIKFSGDYLAIVVAIFGTTISPYLFFWQAAEEVEDEKEDPKAEPLIEAPLQAPRQLARIQLDTLVGMGISNLVAFSS